MGQRDGWLGGFLFRAGAAAFVCLVVHSAVALTPDSPEVKAAVAKAVEFLESEAANDTRLGARALVGLVILKNGGDANHPKVKAAADAIVGSVAKREPADIKHDLYSTGLSIIFLVTLDPSRYRDEVEKLLKSYELRQKSHGGWGYAEKETGDTSMTQYAVLSSWEAAQVGFAIPPATIEKVAIWLLKTQDPAGGFGYQGTPAVAFNLVKQKDVKQSMTAAGLGSLYICADLMSYAERIERRDDLPLAFKEVKAKQEPPPEAEKPKWRVEARQLRQAQTLGNKWMRQHTDIDEKGWTHYYLYALERCSSFRELAEGRAEKEPRWYTEAARYLIRTQAEDGSWVSKAQPTADTAFAALFLLRSTKKSIEKARNFGAGTMVVGHGLPPQTEAIEVRLGRVVTKSDRSPADEIGLLLDRPEHADFARALDALAELPVAEMEALTTKNLAKLEQLSRHRTAAARLAAVRALGRVRNVDHAPALIRALGDGNAEVVAEARAGLARIARRLGTPSAPTNDLERREEVARWKAWYMSVRPDAEFDE